MYLKLGATDQKGGTMAKIKRFDKSKSLGSLETIATYLNRAFTTGDVVRITEAIVTAARTEGMSSVAIKAGVWRETLHRLAGRAMLRTMVLTALNVRLVVTAKRADARHKSSPLLERHSRPRRTICSE
jgi:probable addiction module antidote protein